MQVLVQDLRILQCVFLLGEAVTVTNKVTMSDGKVRVYYQRCGQRVRAIDLRADTSLDVAV